MGNIGSKDSPERKLETLKLEFQWHQHLTTLFATLAVALVALVEALFTQRQGAVGIDTLGDDRWLIASFIGLGLALLGALWSMVACLHYVRTAKIAENITPSLRLRTLGWA